MLGFLGGLYVDGLLFDGRAFPTVFSDGPNRATFVCVGKKRAGATLDGREWREFPK